jgi:hypothetical protein
MAKVTMMKRSVLLKGIAPLMLDPYAGDNKTQLTPEQKFYFLPNGKHELCLPSPNVHSFLCALNTRSAVKSFYEPKVYKNVAAALLGFVSITPFDLPLTRNGKPIIFHEFGQDGITLDRRVARLPNGIPNPKERPVIATPWEVGFDLSIFPNDVFTELEVRNLFEKGGIAIGLGTYRGVYGKFVVEKWDET